MPEVQVTLAVLPLGDRALIIDLGNEASVEAATRVRAVTEHFLTQLPEGVRDVVPGVCSVTLHYDPAAVKSTSGAATPYAALAQQVGEQIAEIDVTTLAPSRTVEIPVCYGGDYGEDLEAVARARGLTVDQAIALHSGAEYRVQMVGFAPGFAYLAGLDPALATPRRETPRTRVPAGSVAIGGALTGIYPLELPGGWHLIGCSPVRLFDPGADPPSLLQMGDCVRFLPITPEAYRRLKQDWRWR